MSYTLPGIDHSRLIDIFEPVRGHARGTRDRPQGSRNLSFVPRSRLIGYENERSPNTNRTELETRVPSFHRIRFRTADETGHVPIVSNVRRKCEGPCLVHSASLHASIPITLARQWVAVQPTVPCNSDVGHLGFCFLINTAGTLSDVYTTSPSSFLRSY